MIWKKCDLRVTKHKRGSFQFGIWNYLWHVFRKFYHSLSLSMYITIKRVRKTFDETLGITGASRSWDLSNLLNAPCPQIIPVGRGLRQRRSCTLTWAPVTPGSGHCWKGTCGVMEQQDPEVPQCPSSTDPWTMPLDTAEPPLGLSWDLLHPSSFPFWAAKHLSVVEPWCNHLSTWGTAGGNGLYCEAVAAGQGEGTGLFCGPGFISVHLAQASKQCSMCLRAGMWQCDGASLSRGQVCAPGTLQALCHPQVIAAQY